MMRQEQQSFKKLGGYNDGKKIRNCIVTSSTVHANQPKRTEEPDSFPLSGSSNCAFQGIETKTGTQICSWD